MYKLTEKNFEELKTIHKESVEEAVKETMSEVNKTLNLIIIISAGLSFICIMILYLFN